MIKRFSVPAGTDFTTHLPPPLTYRKGVKSGLTHAASGGWLKDQGSSESETLFSVRPGLLFRAKGYVRILCTVGIPSPSFAPSSHHYRLFPSPHRPPRHPGHGVGGGGGGNWGVVGRRAAVQ